MTCSSPSLCHVGQCPTSAVTLHLIQLLQSFKIMDYSLLLGIHNMEHAGRERVEEGGNDWAANPEQRRGPGQKTLYCTAMESIQGESRGRVVLDSED